jgi:hypothetical protein
MLRGPFRAVVTVPRLISWHLLSPCKGRTDYSTMRYATLMNFWLVCIVPVRIFASLDKNSENGGCVFMSSPQPVSLNIE